MEAENTQICLVFHVPHHSADCPGCFAKLSVINFGSCSQGFAAMVEILLIVLSQICKTVATTSHFPCKLSKH